MDDQRSGEFPGRVWDKPGYGSLSPLQPELVTQHTVKIRGLERQTTYNFRVLSEDALGNEAQTGNFTFTTS